jgi:DNA-3-methyladenine glycosylase
MKLNLDFYKRHDVKLIARELLGKVICTNLNHQYTSGIIIETEAYEGINDRASHAFGGRRTKRNEAMYGSAGIAYVYLCYGMHHLFNVVTNKCNVPDAILIRAIKPLEGLNIMIERRKQNPTGKNFSAGPGTAAQALGINTSLNGVSLSGNMIWIEDRQINPAENQIIAGPRIGIDYAGKDALLPYRFLVDPAALRPF